jgi:hypothetical protein
MTILYFLEAILTFGLPLAFLSWMVFDWMYSDGQLDREDDPKLIKSKLKNIKQDFKTRGTGQGNFLYRKWMWFGGGFYGLAGLWTFVATEIVDIARFLQQFTDPGYFAGGLIDLLMRFLMNQLGNLINAALWFTYWPGENESTLVWVFVAYAGYWIGVRLAREHTIDAQVQRALHVLRTVTSKPGDNDNIDKP